MIRLSRVNSLLLTAIVVINAYTILLPAWPALHFWWIRHFTHQQQTLGAYTTPAPPSPASAKPAPKVPQDERLIIPAIALNDHIYEGQSTSTINKGVYHVFGTGAPDTGGNTVLAAHRFGFTQLQGIFYHLDLLKKGDKIAVYWQQKRYLYEVERSQVVRPTDTHLVKPTASPTLTLYTCTPLTTAKDRLFVIARLVENPA